MKSSAYEPQEGYMSTSAMTLPSAPSAAAARRPVTGGAAHP
jgi:hypothetical protein